MSYLVSVIYQTNKQTNKEFSYLLALISENTIFQVLFLNKNALLNQHSRSDSYNEKEMKKKIAWRPEWLKRTKKSKRVISFSISK